MTDDLNTDVERSRFLQAVSAVNQKITRLIDKAELDNDMATAKVVKNLLMLLKDPEIVDEIQNYITEHLVLAEIAVEQIIRETAAIFHEMTDDPYLTERACDIEDIGEQLLIALSGGHDKNLSDIPPNTIIIAEDLKPYDTARIDHTKIIAFITEKGGTTSHSAILAKTKGIAAVVGIKSEISKIENNQLLIVDGSAGKVILNPSEDCIALYRKKQAVYEDHKQSLKKFISMECISQSGREIIFGANVGSLEDIDIAKRNGAKAIGLFRSEFLFLDRKTPPTEEEQFTVYRAALQKMQGLPVSIRTLDIGGDKEIPYLDLGKEDNPFLGMRGIRLCLNLPDLFETQLRALLRASVYGKLRIMIPMIDSVADIVQARQIIKNVIIELKQKNYSVDENIAIGAMIEVPAAALIAEELAQCCDFFSIGTNDLTQYTLAVDRTNEHIAKRYDPLHPAVLKLIKLTIDASNNNNIHCGMCGDLAANPNAVPILLKLGLEEFSVSPVQIPEIKRIILTQ